MEKSDRTPRGASRPSESRRARDAEDVLLTQIGESRASAPLCWWGGGGQHKSMIISRARSPRVI